VKSKGYVAIGVPIVRKLFSRAIIAEYKILVLFLGRFAIYKQTKTASPYSHVILSG